MGITKAVLLTFLLVLIELTIQTLFFFGFDMGQLSQNYDHIRGTALIISRSTAYLTIFYFFWKKEDIMPDQNSRSFSLPVILCLFLILAGTEFLNRPFADLDRLFDKTPADYIYTGYSTYQIYATITALLLAPVFEELFFRKFLFQKLLLKHGFLSGLLVSSFLFSFIHWESLLNLVPAFIFGLISAILFYKTGNIFYSILLHFLYNASNQIVYYKAELYSGWLNWLNFGILYWSLFVFGIFITLFALKLIANARSPVTSEE